MNLKQTTVLIFGVFDGIHDGHRHLLSEAKSYGNHLVVALARDSSVLKLKGHLPAHDENRRMADLKLENLADEVYFGDTQTESWNIVRSVRPDVICVGYDQEDLLVAVQKSLKSFDFDIKLVRAKPFKPDRMHSSLLHKSK